MRFAAQVRTMTRPAPQLSRCPRVTAALTICRIRLGRWGRTCAPRSSASRVAFRSRQRVGCLRTIQRVERGLQEQINRLDRRLTVLEWNVRLNSVILIGLLLKLIVFG